MHAPLAVDLAVDTSTLISIVNNESTSLSIQAALATSTGAVISAASLVEASMVAYERFGPNRPATLDRLCAVSGTITMPVDDVDGSVPARRSPHSARGGIRPH